MEGNCILLAEDEPNDVLLLQYAFEQAGLTSRLEVVHDGQEAIDYLSGANHFADRKLHPLPSLVILDLKMPRKTGLEVLEWVRRQPALRLMVVIMLTSSHYPEDVDRAYELGVNSFIVKPFDVEHRLQFAQLLKGWWLGFNQFASTFEATSLVQFDRNGLGLKSSA